MSEITPWYPNTPKTPPHDNYKFQLWGLIFASVIYNIIVKADLGRSPGRSNHPVLISSGQDWQLADLPADLPPVLTSSGQEWQLADLPQCIMGYIMGCIWQPFWILQEKVGISFYFWIIRLVNSQLTLYSHVRNNPLTPNTPKTPPHDNYKFQLWGLIFARCNM